MTSLREAAQQALEALLTYEQYIQPLTNYFGGPRVPEEGSASAKVDAAITALRAALAEPQSTHSTECYQWHHECAVAEVERLRAVLAQQAEPVTIERLRDALVASRIIPPAAVEDPDEYDDGLTLFRIEALHRRIT